FDRARDCCKRAIDSMPNEPRHRDIIAGARDLLGQINRVTGRPDEAVREHESALAIRETLADEQPSDLSRQSDLAMANNSLGLALLAAGQSEKAADTFR